MMVVNPSMKPIINEDETFNWIEADEVKVKQELMDIESENEAVISIDDDPIVTEIPVYFSTEIGNSLKLLQFPTRPFHDLLPTEGRIKRNKLQMKIPLDTKGPHYSEDMGKAFGKGVGYDPVVTAMDVDDPGAFRDRESKKLDFMTLESSPVPMNARYMVGVVAADGFIIIIII